MAPSSFIQPITTTSSVKKRISKIKVIKIIAYFKHLIKVEMEVMTLMSDFNTVFTLFACIAAF